ncbi:hypothetical protein EN857_13530 [Mesorhizobium sp. M4B.F.Ca.ET.214.01.1.1]|nr:MAG: hypothetical protein EOR92_33430 [Mesorhizobium sp.]TGQ37768.1 hypothetical protein EN857_13530 [Mesorhizobium sp. M4B.F.Ca.ET.214.01.1.1]
MGAVAAAETTKAIPDLAAAVLHGRSPQQAMDTPKWVAENDDLVFSRATVSAACGSKKVIFENFILRRAAILRQGRVST